jgi:YggT family protein
MVSIIGQVIYLLLYAFLLFLIARLIMSYIMQFATRWRPGRGAAASLELVWTVTDPPVHALRRVIPPLRIGTVSVDLAFLALVLILVVLMVVVRSQMIS